MNLFFAIVSPACWGWLTAALTCIIPVEVSTHSGKNWRGTFAGLGEQGVQIEVDGQITTVAYDELDELTSSDAELRPPLKTRVLLSGGSEISVRSVSWQDSELVVAPPRQPKLRLPLRRIRAIRFRASSAATDPAWLGILDEETRKDKLVIHRPSGKLDTTSGIIESIADGKVQFSLDGTSVAAPIEKLEGIIFGNTPKPDSAPEITLADTYGSTWAITELVANQPRESVQIRIDEITHEIPIELVRRIRWSSGVMMLTRETPAESNLRPAVKTKVQADLYNQLFGPEPSGEADLILNGGTRLEYRVEPGYRIFKGSVRREPGVKLISSTVVRIFVDDQSVWQQSLDAVDQKEPDGVDRRGFELDVSNARRLRIEVDSGSDGDLGCRILLSRPRLLK